MDILSYATEKHKGQFRKGNRNEPQIPYIEHPKRVYEILKSYGYDSYFFYHVSIGHDLIEDTNATFEEISQLYGEEIAIGILGLSKPKGIKKSEYLKTIFTKEDERLITLKIADRICNIEDILKLNNEFLSFKMKYLKETKESFVPRLKKSNKLHKRLLDLCKELEKSLK